MLKFSRKESRRRNSVLFVNPDYHCTIVHRNFLRSQGWKSDIYLTSGFPIHMLYDSDLLPPTWVRSSILRKSTLFSLLSFLWAVSKYRILLFYGRPPNLTWIAQKLRIRNMQHWFWHPYVVIPRILGKKLVYLPSGCRDEFSQRTFEKFDSGKVCGNCGFYNKCNDDLNLANLYVFSKFVDRTLGAGFFTSPHILLTTARWKVIDLNLWNPTIDVPKEFRLPKTNALRILHSHSLVGRLENGRNIKGSNYIAEAIKKLQQENNDIEYIEVTGVKPVEMRFMQAQADIVVDQLFYGHWGSTGIEAMALGKPVISYMRKSWMDSFRSSFPDIGILPVINATPETIYEVLKSLISDPENLQIIGQKSRLFAELHYNPEINCPEIMQLFSSLHSRYS